MGSVEASDLTVLLQCGGHFSSKTKGVKVRFFETEIQTFEPKYANLSEIGMFLELINFLPKITRKNRAKTCVF
jgi:hypothetical protein